MITAIEIENFKAFGPRQRIELRPLTLLFGANSSGKSSILHALHYLREVLCAGVLDVRYPWSGGGVIDLGGVRNLVHGRVPGRLITLKVDLKVDGIELADYSKDAFVSNPDDVSSEYVEAVRGAITSASVELQIDTATLRIKLATVWLNGAKFGSLSFPPGHPFIRIADLDLEHPVLAGERPIAGRSISLAHDAARGDAVRGHVDRLRERATAEFNELAARLDQIWAGFPRTGSGADLGAILDELIVGVDWLASHPARCDLECAEACRQLLLRCEQVHAGRTDSSPEDLSQLADCARAVIEHAKSGLPRGPFLPRSGRLASQTINDVATRAKALRAAVKKSSVAVSSERRRPQTWSRIERMLRQGGPSAEDSVADAIAAWMVEGGRPPESVVSKAWFSELMKRLNARSLDRGGRGERWASHFRDLFRASLGDRASSREIELPLPTRLLPRLDRRLSIPTRGSDPHAHLELEVVLSTLLLGPIEFLRRHIDGLRYVGPLRVMPSRNFEVLDDGGRSGWPSGLAAWRLLLEDDTRRDAAMSIEKLLSRVNAWLEEESRLATGYRLERALYRQVPTPIVEQLRHAKSSKAIEKIIKGNREIMNADEPRIFLHDIARNLLLHPRDVGVGFSQLVPVVVAILHLGSSVVSLEQPELHLHPKQQAAMGDLLIEGAKANPKRLMLIETHSEYMVLRLLRRIRETGRERPAEGLSLTPRELRVYYAARDGASTSLKAIDVDTQGDLVDPWPDDFFEQDFKERFS